MTEHMSVCSSGLKRESYRESGGLAVNLSIMRLYLKLYVCVCVCARVCALHKVTHLLYLCTQSNPTQRSSRAALSLGLPFLSCYFLRFFSSFSETRVALSAIFSSLLSTLAFCPLIPLTFLADFADFVAL